MKRAGGHQGPAGIGGRDADRLARFQREAEVLASLNHPNIASHLRPRARGRHHGARAGIGRGPTLADRIAQGPIPIDEALPIARQIAQALEAAHEHGIIHRDLKPANIKLRPDGTAKVLDFGLAKSFEQTAGSHRLRRMSPTLTSTRDDARRCHSGHGGLMCPEQAVGRPVDRRTDIWAFGCVLFEMLTGQKPFDGETLTDIVAAIVKNEPDLAGAATRNAGSRSVSHREVPQEDPSQRLRDIADGRFQIEEVLNDPGASEARSRSRFGWRSLAVVAAAAVGGRRDRRRVVAPVAEAYASDPLENELSISCVTEFPQGPNAVPAISRDGRFVAFRF